MATKHTYRSPICSNPPKEVHMVHFLLDQNKKKLRQIPPYHQTYQPHAGTSKVGSSPCRNHAGPLPLPLLIHQPPEAPSKGSETSGSCVAFRWFSFRFFFPQNNNSQLMNVWMGFVCFFFLVCVFSLCRVLFFYQVVPNLKNISWTSSWMKHTIFGSIHLSSTWPTPHLASEKANMAATWA